MTLQTDNVGCYQSKEFLLLLAILNGCNKIKVTRYIHTETQDGKGLIDAHFAKGTAHLLKFMKTSQQNRIQVIATASKGPRCCTCMGMRNPEFFCSA